jgi:NAD(P)-dependent dehydrogenase (short-subunit alcohol dehydrogenase family)
VRRDKAALRRSRRHARRNACDLIAPEDIANLALFLASDDSRLITKQTISVNAGVL